MISDDVKVDGKGGRLALQVVYSWSMSYHKQIWHEYRTNIECCIRSFSMELTLSTIVTMSPVKPLRSRICPNKCDFDNRISHQSVFS